MKRRGALAAIGAGLLGAGALALHPRDRGAPHNAYFVQLASALRTAGIATPTLVIDHQRLMANAAQVTRNIGARMQLRLVAKSLPCLPLLDELGTAMGTQRKVKSKQAPPPGAWRQRTSPPMARASSREMVRPRPVPMWPWVLVLALCSKA